MITEPKVAELLERWRAAERALDGVDPDAVSYEPLVEEADAARRDYQAAFEARLADEVRV